MPQEFSESEDDAPYVDLVEERESDDLPDAVADVIEARRHDAGLDLEAVAPELLKGPPAINDAGLDLETLAAKYVQSDATRAAAN